MKLRVSLPEHVGPVHWTTLIGVVEGLYEAEGLEIEHFHLGHDEQTERLLSGDTPIEKHGPDGDIALMEAGRPIRIVAGLLRKPPVYVFGAPGVRTLADLRGRTLAAVSPKFGSSLALRMVLDDAGLREGDYTLQLIGGTERRYNALLDGSVAATIITPPQSFAAVRAGLPLLANVPELYPNFLFSAVVANVPFARANPDAVVRYLRAEIRAQRRLADPAAKGAMIAILADAARMSQADATSCYDDLVARDQVYCTDGRIAPEDLHDLVEGLRRLGDSDPHMAPAGYLDLSWLEAAHASLSTV